MLWPFTSVTVRHFIFFFIDYMLHEWFAKGGREGAKQRGGIKNSPNPHTTTGEGTVIYYNCSPFQGPANGLVSGVLLYTSTMAYFTGCGTVWRKEAADRTNKLH